MSNIANIIIIRIKNIAQRLKIKSPFQFFAVMMVFSVTGSLSLILSRPLLIFFGLDPEITNIYFFWFLRIIILFFRLSGFTHSQLHFFLGNSLISGK